VSLSLAELAAPLLHFIHQVRAERIEIPPEAALRERLRTELARFLQVALQAGHPRPVVESAQYALAAGIDESLHFSRWPGKHGWSVHPLMVELFEERTAGVKFFDRLAQEEKSGSAALEIYYQVMALGFRGRFHAQPEGVDRLIARIAPRLGGEATGGLSPAPTQARAPEVTPKEWSMPLLAILLLGGAALLNVVYAVILSVLRSGVLDRLSGGAL